MCSYCILKLQLATTVYRQKVYQHRRHGMGHQRTSRWRARTPSRTDIPIFEKHLLLLCNTNCAECQLSVQTHNEQKYRAVDVHAPMVQNYSALVYFRSPDGKRGTSSVGNPGGRPHFGHFTHHSMEKYVHHGQDNQSQYVWSLTVF